MGEGRVTPAVLFSDFVTRGHSRTSCPEQMSWAETYKLRGLRRYPQLQSHLSWCCSYTVGVRPEL